MKPNNIVYVLTSNRGNMEFKSLEDINDFVVNFQEIDNGFDISSCKVSMVKIYQLSKKSKLWQVTMTNLK